jgi:hypothetical protein
MTTIDEINSKLELCMRIIKNTLECPSCSEKAQLEIDNYNHTITPKEGDSLLQATNKVDLDQNEYRRS